MAQANHGLSGLDRERCRKQKKLQCSYGRLQFSETFHHTHEYSTPAKMK